MKPFTEDIRYEYDDLTPESVVIDAGGYEGDFAAEIHRRYGCRVMVLEPVLEFWDRIQKRFESNSKIEVCPFGVGGHASCPYFTIKGSMTGPWADQGATERVVLIPMSAVMMASIKFWPIEDCALLKLNIEGAEFEVLENMIAEGIMHRFRNIQVQWHPVVPDCEARREKIIAALAVTHELTFDYGWVWQNWALAGGNKS